MKRTNNACSNVSQLIEVPTGTHHLCFKSKNKKKVCPCVLLVKQRGVRRSTLHRHVCIMDLDINMPTNRSDAHSQVMKQKSGNYMQWLPDFYASDVNKRSAIFQIYSSRHEHVFGDFSTRVVI